MARQTYDRYEVIVVDDGSSDNTSEFLGRFAADHPDMALRWVRSEARVGANPSRNRGVRESRGEFVAFVDDDCIAAPDWLERLMSGFVADNVAAVTGRVDDPEPANIYELTLKGTHRVHGCVRATRLVAGNMCVRRDLLLEYGLDEDRAKVSSDVAVSGRGDEEGLYLMLKAAGYEQRVVHDAAVLHEHGCSRRTFFGQAYRSGGSAARLGYKYHLPPRIELVPLLLAYFLLPLWWFGLLGLLPSTLAGALFLAAIVYNDLFRKKKTAWETLITFPLLLTYYHMRLAGYVVQYVRLWVGLDKIERVRLQTFNRLSKLSRGL
jgi:glycosyltransferase involved in cell wall biosynthesis